MEYVSAHVNLHQFLLKDFTWILDLDAVQFYITN